MCLQLEQMKADFGKEVSFCLLAMIREDKMSTIVKRMMRESSDC